MNPSAMIKHMFPALCLPLALVLAGCEMSGDSPTGKPPLEGARIGGPFTLVDKNGKTVKWSDFDGRYRIVYFGYAYCPDVCPFDMQKLMQGFAKFAKAHPDLADDVQPIFITIDPARDTPQVIGEFTSAFSDRLLGLTGTPEQLEAASAAFFFTYQKVDPVVEGGDYDIQHPSIGYLVDREGQPMATIPVEQSPEAVAAELEKWVR